MLRRCRSSQKPPFAPSSSASTSANHTIVSAPASADRNTGFVIEWKRGSDFTTPGVSTQPGCIAWKIAFDPQRLAHSTFSSTCARFARAYARTPLYESGLATSFATSSFSGYMPPEATAITRPLDSPASSNGRSNEVRRNGPRTCEATVISKP